MHWARIRAIRATYRLAGVAVLVIASVSISGSQAFGVIRGKTVAISAAPWTVLVVASGQGLCTGVIINSRTVLTAGHCVTVGESARPVLASSFWIEAGVSNFKHPLKPDHRQLRGVSSFRLMPGYVPVKLRTSHNQKSAVGHDLAVLTLSRPLDLSGDDAKAANLPTSGHEPSPKARLVMAGFGQESANAGAKLSGNLNEITKFAFYKICSTGRVLCELPNRGSCWGDSGAGLIEAGQRPTVVGILSQNQATCDAGFNGYVAISAPAVLRFIRNSKPEDSPGHSSVAL